MKTVYVVQNQHRLNGKSHCLEPKFDLSPAEEFGQLSYLLNPSASPFRPESVIQELHEKLKDFGPGDHLLLVGNPVLIGFAVAIAAHYSGGEVSLLQWSGKAKRYINITTSGLFTF